MKSRGQDNIELVMRFYQAVQSRDWASASSLLDANVEWTEPQAEGIWFGGTHRGAKAVLREVIEPAFDRVTGFRIDVEQYFDAGDHVVVLANFQGRVKATGKELRAHTAHVYTLRNGKIARFHAYQDVAALQAAVGVTHTEERRIAA